MLKFEIKWKLSCILILTEVIIIVNLKQELSTWDDSLKLDASKESTWKLAVKAIGLFWRGCEPVPQHRCPQIWDALSNICRSKIIPTTLGKRQPHHETCLHMSLQHYFRFHSCKKPKSPWHLNHRLPLTICTTHNLIIIVQTKKIQLLHKTWQFLSTTSKETNASYHP